MKAASPSSTNARAAAQSVGDKSPLTVLAGIGPQREKIFNDHGFRTVADILDFLPKSYLDLSVPSDCFTFTEPRLYQAILKRYSLRYLRTKRSVITLGIDCCGQNCTVSLFNQAYLVKKLKTGAPFFFHGQAQQYRDKITFTQPLILPADHPACLPRYRSIGPFSSTRLHQIILLALQGLSGVSNDIPADLQEKNRFTSRIDSWRAIHQPENITAASLARAEHQRRLTYREFLLFHLQLAVIRQQFRERPRKYRYRLDDSFSALVQSRLPFQLTTTQERSQNDILTDLSSEKTMQRLLCGDVGSGKTVIAFISILAALHSGYQAALLVPTDILARQHLEKALQFFKGYRVGLLCGDLSPSESRTIRKHLANGSVQLIIGTHALLQSQIRFSALSLVVIDEQHRFGVAQRAALHTKRDAIDLLTISATPIPRTLLLSHYSDMSTSTISDLPPGRKPILTTHIPPQKRREFYHHLKRRTTAGEKAFIVVPRIVPEEENPNLFSIETLQPQLKRMLGENNLGMVHGRLDANQRQKTMSEFIRGEKKVLLATSVIEVGIDDQDVSVIVIENADRFGLATLHQLRGRVGRGHRSSHCFLISSPDCSSQGLERINILCRTSDGFLIARRDLQMRGGGLIAGSEQIGNTSFQHGDPFKDRVLFLQARQDVAEELSLITPPEELRDAILGFRSEYKRISFS